jgi:hypothetical protein
MSPSNNIIVKDPEILGGTPVFRGTRVPVQGAFRLPRKWRNARGVSGRISFCDARHGNCHSRTGQRSSCLTLLSLTAKHAYTRILLAQELLEATHGVGAFRMFRSTIRRLSIEESWYRFREDALAEIARDWLGAHELPYR